jgi:hypothetical protein
LLMLMLTLGGVVGLEVCALRVLGLGRTGVLRVHGLLLLMVLCVRVLVVDGWVAGYVGGLGVLLHGDCEVLVGCSCGIDMRGCMLELHNSVEESICFKRMFGKAPLPMQRV